MRVRKTVSVILAAALMTIGLGATGASAAAGTHDSGSPTSGVVGGREFGPKDGYEVTTETYPVVSGAGPIEVFYDGASSGTGITPMATWGASYAISTENLLAHYYGKAKAAANIYSGQRIIQVCIWYSNPGNSSPTVCSTANSTGSAWIAGDEHHVTFWDNLSVNWPQTQFNIQTTRIDPNIY